MRTITLTQGRVALVDDEDYEELNKHHWQVKITKDRRAIYAVRTIKYNYKRTTERMHRRILGLKIGDGIMTDHINCNGLDNQRSNLRFCTNQQNQANSQTIHTQNAPYKGVYIYPRKNSNRTWVAKIMVNGKHIQLGYYLTAKKAAHAYNEAAKQHFGEFARLNKLS